MTAIKIVIASANIIEQTQLKRLLGAQAGFSITAQTADLSATYYTVEETMPDVVLVAENFAQTQEYDCMVSLFNAVEAVPVIISSGAPLGILRQTQAQISTSMALGEISGILKAAMGRKPKIANSTFRPSQSNSLVSSPSVSREITPNILQFESGKILLIGASTGGIDALTEILQSFPANCPPTAIVQHTGQNFSETLVRLLNSRCAAEVVTAKTGIALLPGRIVLAGGIEGHLRLNIGQQITCNVVTAPPMSGHCPSIDELFLSAVPIASRVVGVILTGMGRDGALGLLRLRRAGAITIGQNEKTSIVYGMPRVAHELGAVQMQMALADIGPEVLRRCAASGPARTELGAV